MYEILSVYPSYPATGSKSSTLIVSYCWTEDAYRLGGMINSDGTADPRLIDMVLRDLSVIHDGTNVSQYYTPDASNYYAWSWTNYPQTLGENLSGSDIHKLRCKLCYLGAYAFFGPGEFSDEMYAQLCQPAATGKLFIAGEATSSCHAYVDRDSLLDLSHLFAVGLLALWIVLGVPWLNSSYSTTRQCPRRPLPSPTSGVLQSIGPTSFRAPMRKTPCWKITYV